MDDLESEARYVIDDLLDVMADAFGMEIRDVMSRDYGRYDRREEIRNRAAKALARLLRARSSGEA